MIPNQAHILIAGAGIGGLATALALSKAGARITVLERANGFGEVGAGVQLGPNAFGVLTGWGLRDALLKVVNFPAVAQARDVATNTLLSELPLGDSVRLKYGFDWATIHRADLHRILLDAVRQLPLVSLHLKAKISSVSESEQLVQITTELGESYTADALIGCDGLWSQVRKHVLGEQMPLAIGRVAWRALLPMHAVPPELQTERVTVWMGPKMHVISYPVRRSQFMNLVVMTEDDQLDTKPNPQSWNCDANGASPLKNIKIGRQPSYLLPGLLSNLFEKVTETDGGGWTCWTLFDRDPMTSSHDMVHPGHPRIALLGDAAHPMRPDLAQGAAMALEDAQVLGDFFASAIAKKSLDIPAVLQQYAEKRWQRAARVQAQSRRNGKIFHMQGIMRWLRDVALALFGSRLMDQPWLYRHTYPVKSTF